MTIPKNYMEIYHLLAIHKSLCMLIKPNMEAWWITKNTTFDPEVQYRANNLANVMLILWIDKKRLFYWYVNKKIENLTRKHPFLLPIVFFYKFYGMSVWTITVSHKQKVVEGVPFMCILKCTLFNIHTHNKFHYH